MQTINWREILRLMFVRDWPWKLLSLVIACMLYFSIRAQISHVRPYSVPVDGAFDSGDTGVVIESVEPRSVQVKLRGSNSDLNQINPDILLFDISPKRKKNNAVPADSETVRLRTSQLRNANRLRVVDIEPPEVQVRFDVPASLQLNIARPEITGVARGQVRLLYDQTSATVTGSRRLLATLDAGTVQVMSTLIDVEGRTQSFQTRVALSPPGDPTRLKVTPSEMVVNVQITNEKATKRIGNVPVQVIPLPPDNPPWTCIPPTVELHVEGSPKEIANVRREDFSVIANVVEDDSENFPYQEIPLTVLVRQGTTMTATPAPLSIELRPPPDTNPE